MLCITQTRMWPCIGLDKGQSLSCKELPDATTGGMFVMEAFVPVDAPLESELGDMAWVVRLIVCDGCVVDFGGLLSFFAVFYVD